MKKRVFMLLLAMLLTLAGSCRKPLPVQPVNQDVAQILCSEDKIPRSGHEYIYRQALSSLQDHSKGMLYAWKISTLSGNMPSGYQTDAQGWLIRGSGQSQSIWSESSNLYMDFHSENGILRDLITAAELQAKHPDGRMPRAGFALPGSIC